MANLFIPFQVRTALEQKRRDVEFRLRGTYGGPDAAFHQTQDQDLLDLIEIIDNICNQTRVEDDQP
jgi:hypothetical protein